MICCLHFFQESLLKENTQKELVKIQLEGVAEQTDDLQREVKSSHKGPAPYPALVSNCTGAGRFWLDQGSLFLSGAVLWILYDQIGLNLAHFYALVRKGS